MWLLMYLLKIDSALWGVHHYSKRGLVAYRRTWASYLVSDSRVFILARIPQTFANRRGSSAKVRNSDHKPPHLSHTPKRAHVPFFNSRIACICENHCGVVVLRTLLIVVSHCVALCWACMYGVSVGCSESVGGRRNRHHSEGSQDQT